MKNTFRSILSMLALLVVGVWLISYGVYRFHSLSIGEKTVEERAWDFTCAATVYDCTGLDTPYVTKTLTMGPYHHGMFFGGNVLFINWVSEPEKYPYDFATLVHGQAPPYSRVRHTLESGHRLRCSGLL